MELRDAKFRWVAAVLIAIGLLGVRLLRRYNRGLPEVRFHDSANEKPRPPELPDPGLVMEATIEPGLADTRRIVLRRDDGELTLFLDAPRPAEGESTHARFGVGRIEAGDPTRGGAMLSAIAGWLGQKTPAMPLVRAPTAAMPFEYVQLDEGGDGNPERLKLFLHRRTQDAELYLLLDPGGLRAHLVEKDVRYRRALVELLAAPLRDGAPPKRSPVVDPHLTSATPLFAEAVWLPGAIDVTTPAFADDILLGARADEGSTIVRWKDLSKPPEILEHLDGAVGEIVGSPKAKLVALTLRGASGRWSTMLLDVVSGALTPLVAPPGFDELRGPLRFSPDGAMLAATAVHETTARACVVDPATRKWTSVSDVEGTPSHWQKASLFLDDAPDAKGGKTYVWFPATGKPSAFPAPLRFDSPDGRFTFGIGDKELFLDQPGVLEHVAFVPSIGADLEAIESMGVGGPRFLGPHALLLASDDVYLVSLDDMRLHQLTSRADVTDVVAARADGKILIVRAEDGEAYVLK